MKDLLVDMHSPAYHHLMARANYSVDAHSYLENYTIFAESWIDQEIIQQFAESWIDQGVSFNKGNAQNNKHGNSKSKAHIRPTRTTRNTVRINAGSIQTMIIHGLPVLIIPRVRLIGATRIPTITTMP
jgi:hypothetical protein